MNNQRRCFLCKEEKDFYSFNGYGECEPCADKKTKKQQEASGIPNDFGKEAKDAVANAIARFPKEFGLRAWPGARFQLGTRESYVSRGIVLLYTQKKQQDGSFSDFCKGTEEELRREITP